MSDGASAARYTYRQQNSIKKTEVELNQESWGVMGHGKVGKLPSWARETEYGIEDSAGKSLLRLLRDIRC